MGDLRQKTGEKRGEKKTIGWLRERDSCPLSLTIVLATVNQLRVCEVSNDNGLLNQASPGVSYYIKLAYIINLF